MPPSAPDDNSLLDRLNALKPTAVTLEKSANTAIPPGPEAPPVSREDALSARLRSLRSHSSSTGREGGDVHNAGGASPGHLGNGGASAAALPSLHPPGLGRPSPERKLASKAFPASPARPGSAGQKRPSYRFVEAEADDESAVDELLEALADEDFDPAADDDAEAPSPGSSPGAVASPRKPPGEDSDDSDGEPMSRAVETILAQLGDEISALPPPPASGPAHHAAGADTTGGDATATATATAASSDEPALTLPTVPSGLADPAADHPGTAPPDAFEQDLAARMASLRGLGTLDALGLPSAPTFRPQDHAPPGRTSGSGSGSGSGLLRSNRYTDADQRTWCVVCLEDAAVRCIGCGGDVYCARCWKEMHVGPSAGFDERGHQWVTFERTGRA